MDDESGCIKQLIHLTKENAPWYEVSPIILEFHEKKQEELGKAKSGTPGHEKKIGWSVRDTAAALGISLSRAAEHINLGRLLKQDDKARELVYAKAISRIRRNRK